MILLVVARTYSASQQKKDTLVVGGVVYGNRKNEFSRPRTGQQEGSSPLRPYWLDHLELITQLCAGCVALPHSGSLVTEYVTYSGA